MKELSIEQKAQAYDGVREKIAIRFGSNVAEEIFSEYEESEDERIRKALINGFNKLDKSAVWYNGITNGQILDWLERQGKNSMGISEATKQELEDNLNKALEKETPESFNEFLDEQKPADKVEPKFKVGDWLVHKEMVGVTCCITQIHAPHYYLTKNNSFIKFGEEDNYRPWTIQDAKDGDVLYNKDDVAGNSVFIYKGISDKKTHTYLYYTRLFRDKDFSIYNDVMLKNGSGVSGGGFYPATKEQCDLLFQKMKEAGYEWDAEKKELKKIEQKFTENEELTEFDKAVGVSIGTWNPKTPEQIQSVKVVSKKLLKLAKKQINDEQKTAWSEEDEKNLNEALSYIKDETLKNFIKDRVQPQNIACYNPYKEVVESIAEMCKHYDKASHSGLRDFYDNVKVKCKDAKEYDSLFPQNTWKPSDLPHWKKSNLPNDNVTGFNSDYFCHKGYGINYKELFDKLPKDD